jgi:hypothetical protein
MSSDGGMAEYAQATVVYPCDSFSAKQSSDGLSDK